jgi:hypothetical protein
MAISNGTFWKLVVLSWDFKIHSLPEGALVIDFSNDCWICALLVVLPMSRHRLLPFFPKRNWFLETGFFPNSSQFPLVEVKTCIYIYIYLKNTTPIARIMPSAKLVWPSRLDPKSSSPRPSEASLQLGFRWRKWFLGLARPHWERRARVVW